jgi:hypothetical protein
MYIHLSIHPSIEKFKVPKTQVSTSWKRRKNKRLLRWLLQVKIFMSHPGRITRLVLVAVQQLGANSDT